MRKVARRKETAGPSATPDFLWSLMALINACAFLYGKAHTWICLVQRDRKSGFARDDKAGEFIGINNPDSRAKPILDFV
jgi:hypothetical protein